MPDRDLAAALNEPVSVVKAELFKALAHPARIRALEVLVDGERSVGEMQPLVGIELSHLSQQLGVLRRAGLVEHAPRRAPRSSTPSRTRTSANCSPRRAAS